MAVNPPVPSPVTLLKGVDAFLADVRARFVANRYGKLDETDFLAVFELAAEVFADWRHLTVKRVKGATYPVPYTDSLGLVPPDYRILGMQAEAVNGVDSATGAAGVTAPPVFFALLKDSAGPVDALLDAEPTTVLTVKAKWVRLSGSDEDILASFEPLELEDRDYAAGDVRWYEFPNHQKLLVQWKADSVGFTHPAPTGLDSDPIYRLFAPLIPTGLATFAYVDAELAEIRAVLTAEVSAALAGVAQAPSADNPYATASDLFVDFRIEAGGFNGALTPGDGVCHVLTSNTVVTLPSVRVRYGMLYALRVPKQAPAPVQVTFAGPGYLDGGRDALVMQPGEIVVIRKAPSNSSTQLYQTVYRAGTIPPVPATLYGHDLKLSAGPTGTLSWALASSAPAGPVADVVLWTHQSNDSGLSNRNELAPADVAEVDANTQVFTLDKVAGTMVPYRLGTTDPGTGYPVGATDKAITKQLLPAFDNGFGPDVYFVLSWLRDPANAGKKLFIFKKDLLHPLSSTNGASIAAWLDGTNNFPPIYDGFLAEWQQQQTALQAMGYTLGGRLWIDGGGEQDSDESNPDYQVSLERFYQRLLSDGILTAQSKVLIAKKQRDLTYHPFDATIAAAQAAFVAAHSGVAKLVDLAYPTFMDATHYAAESMKRLGTLEYRHYAGAVVAMPSNWATLTFSDKAGDFVSDGANNWHTTATGGSWGHGGKSDLTLAAYATGGLCMHYTSAAGAAGVLGLHDASAREGITGMRFSFYIEPTGTLSIFYKPVGSSTAAPVSTVLTAAYGYYWLGRFDGAICILYSTDRTTWTLFYRFPPAYDTDAKLYPMVDVNSGDPTFGLQQPQGAGLS